MLSLEFILHQLIDLSTDSLTTGSTDPTQQECEGSIWDVIQNTPELSNFMQLVSSADIAMLFKGTTNTLMDVCMCSERERERKDTVEIAPIPGI